MSNEHWPTSPPDGLHPPLPLPCESTDQLEKLFSDSLNALHFTRKNFVLIARIKEGCLRRKGRQWGQNEDFGASLMNMSLRSSQLFIHSQHNNVSLLLSLSPSPPFAGKTDSHQDHNDKYHGDVDMISICISRDDQGHRGAERTSRQRSFVLLQSQVKEGLASAVQARSSVPIAFA